MFPIFFSFLALSLWNSSHIGTLFPNQSPEFTGEGTATITKDGRLVLEGDAPRYRVLEPLFDDVSITLDARRVSEAQDLDYQGFVIGARSQHYDDSICGANTYYASITYDGYARFEKELFHGEGQNAFYPDFNSDDQVRVFTPDVPKNIWIKLNFTITTDEDNNARLQLSVDNQNTLDYTDNGNWPVDDDDIDCEGFYPDNKIIQSPGFMFIRNDGLGRAEYRNLSITEK